MNNIYAGVAARFVFLDALRQREVGVKLLFWPQHPGSNQNAKPTYHQQFPYSLRRKVRAKTSSAFDGTFSRSAYIYTLNMATCPHVWLIKSQLSRYL